jgi:hypothetical protein
LLQITIFFVLEINAYWCCKSLHIWVANGVANHYYSNFLIYLLFKISIFHSAAVAEGTGVGGGGQSFSPPEQEEPLHAPRPSPCTHFLLHPCTQHVVNN